jgi:hypothetical protein
MNAISIDKIARAADDAIPAQPDKHPMHLRLKHHREMLIVGIIYEMAYLKPSYPEIGAVVGCAHSTAMNHLDRWREIPWQDRYGWLRLVEGRLRYETNAVDAAVL